MRLATLKSTVVQLLTATEWKYCH